MEKPEIEKLYELHVAIAQAQSLEAVSASQEIDIIIGQSSDIVKSAKSKLRNLPKLIADYSELKIM